MPVCLAPNGVQTIGIMFIGQAAPSPNYSLLMKKKNLKQEIKNQTLNPETPEPYEILQTCSPPCYTCEDFT